MAAVTATATLTVAVTGAAAATTTQLAPTGRETAGYPETIHVSRAPRRRSIAGVTQPQRDWTAATRWGVSGVNIQPWQATEDRNESGVTPASTWRLITQRGIDIDLEPGDHVEWNGKTLEVAGEPQRFMGRGWRVHHVEAVLTDQTLTTTGAAGVTAATRAAGLAGTVSIAGVNVL